MFKKLIFFKFLKDLFTIEIQIHSASILLKHCKQWLLNKCLESWNGKTQKQWQIISISCTIKKVREVNEGTIKIIRSKVATGSEGPFSRLCTWTGSTQAHSHALLTEQGLQGQQRWSQSPCLPLLDHTPCSNSPGPIPGPVLAFTPGSPLWGGLICTPRPGGSREVWLLSGEELWWHLNLCGTQPRCEENRQATGWASICSLAGATKW